MPNIHDPIQTLSPENLYGAYESRARSHSQINALYARVGSVALFAPFESPTRQHIPEENMTYASLVREARINPLTEDQYRETGIDDTGSLLLLARPVPQIFIKGYSELYGRPATGARYETEEMFRTMFSTFLANGDTVPYDAIREHFRNIKIHSFPI